MSIRKIICILENLFTHPKGMLCAYQCGLFIVVFQQALHAYCIGSRHIVWWVHCDFSLDKKISFLHQSLTTTHVHSHKVCCNVRNWKWLKLRVYNLYPNYKSVLTTFADNIIIENSYNDNWQFIFYYGLVFNSTYHNTW